MKQFFIKHKYIFLRSLYYLILVGSLSVTCQESVALFGSDWVDFLHWSQVGFIGSVLLLLWSLSADIFRFVSWLFKKLKSSRTRG